MLSRAYYNDLISQKWVLEKSSKYLVPLLELQLALLKYYLTENGNLHGLYLSIKNTPIMQLSVTTGSPLQTRLLLRGRIVKFTD